MIHNILFGVLIALAVLVLLLLLYILFLWICSLFIDKKKLYDHDSRFYRFLLVSATRLAFLVCRIRIHETGTDLIPTDGRFLLVCNHRSKFDPLATWLAYDKYQLAFVSKESNFNVPIFGRYIRKCCFMPIDRENPKNALQTLSRASMLINNNEVNIAIYPEGKRNYEPELLPFHDGIFKVAKKSHVPIVVMTIQGTEKISKRAPFRKTDIYLDVLKVMSTDYVDRLKTHELSEEAKKLMEEHLNK